MSFLFYISGTLVNQPENDPKSMVISTVSREQDTGMITIVQDVVLEWNHKNLLNAGETDGYTLIKDAFDLGICNELEVIITDQVSVSQTNLVYTGIFKLTQVEIDEQREFIKCKVQDNSWRAYTQNNKEVQVNLAGTFTKSKLNAIPIDQYLVDLFNSNGCAYGSFAGILFHAYRVSDVFDFIVRGITDNKVEFRSDYLDSLDPNLFIIKGQDLLNPFTLFPLAPQPEYVLSFQQMYTEIHKAKNIAMWIDGTDPDAPILRLENYEATFSGDILYTFPDIKHLRTYVDGSRLYGTVSVGSDTTHFGNSVWYTFNDATSHQGWGKEQYFPLGQCNTNTELDLLNTFVLSNNSIQDTMIGQSTSDIDKYFLLEMDDVDTVGLTATEHQYDFFGQGFCLHNFGLNNFSKMQRHSTSFETAFGTFLGVGGNGFRALLGSAVIDFISYTTLGSAPGFVPPGGQTFDSEFVNETQGGGYDGGNNYNNVIFEYVVPVNGDYSFTQNLIFGIAGIYRPSIFVTVFNEILLYDSAMTLKDFSSVVQDYHNDGNYQFPTTFVLNAVAGDIVKARYRIEFNGVFGGPGSQPIAQFLTLSYQSYFECNGTPDGGVTITTGTSDLKKLRHEFIADIPESVWRTIVANPVGQLGFQKDGVTRYGWIEYMRHDHQTGRTEIKLITNNAITTQ